MQSIWDVYFTPIFKPDVQAQSVCVYNKWPKSLWHDSNHWILLISWFQSRCRDKSSICDWRRKKGSSCFSQYMKENCQKTCGRCSSSSSSSSSSSYSRRYKDVEEYLSPLFSWVMNGQEQWVCYVVEFTEISNEVSRWKLKIDKLLFLENIPGVNIDPS